MKDERSRRWRQGKPLTYLSPPILFRDLFYVASVFAVNTQPAAEIDEARGQLGVGRERGGDERCVRLLRAMLLQAMQREVRAKFVRHGVMLAGIGVVLGLAAAAAATRLLTSLLFDVRPLDVPTYAGGAVVLVLAAALASYLPARKASNVDPTEALAAE